jgi:predicted GIY-YIG superfamily endonuclease
MPKKSNLIEFKIKYLAKYPNSNYSFEKATYKNSSTKITCICPIHGDFNISPNKLMDGRKCAECAGNVPIKDISDFLNRNGDKKNIRKYLYDKAIYLGDANKMMVRCKNHGVFQIKPNALLNGQGCPSCAKNKPYKDFDDFLNRNKNNNNIKKFEIDKNSFLNSKSKLSLNCSIHGWFYMNVDDLLRGCDCNKCAIYGFNRLKPATLYILEMKKECGLNAIGYGISNNFNYRIVQHEKNFKKNNVDWVLLKTINFEKGIDCLNIENKIKSKTKKLNFNVDGFRTEATYIDNLPIINQIINNIKI